MLPIGYIERGDYFPSPDLAFRLSELFGVPVEMIFSRQPFTPLSTALAGGDRHDCGHEPSRDVCPQHFMVLVRHPQKLL